MSALRCTRVGKRSSGSMALRVGAYVQEAVSNCSTLDEFFYYFNTRLSEMKSGNNVDPTLSYEAKRDDGGINIYKIDSKSDRKVIYSVYTV